MTLPVLALYGPTASGKSALALELTERIDAVIINSDSKQVCRELPVLTAQPSAGDLARAAHRLYGHVSAADPYPSERWMSEAVAAAEAAEHEGKVPVFVGGTGMFVQMLLEGASPLPPVPLEAEVEAEKFRREAGPEAAHAALAEADPVFAARVFPADAPRVTRGLAVFYATGIPLSRWHAAPKRPLLPGRKLVAAVRGGERERFYMASDARFDGMMRDGAVEEAAVCLKLLGEDAEAEAKERGLPRPSPFLKAHGLPELIAWMKGELTREQAVAQAKLNTRHYIKRQFTWARGQLADVPRVHSLQEWLALL